MKRAGYRTVYKIVLILEMCVATVLEETHRNTGSAVMSASAACRALLLVLWATWDVRLHLAHSSFTHFLEHPYFLC